MIGMAVTVSAKKNSNGLWCGFEFEQMSNSIRIWQTEQGNAKSLSVYTDLQFEEFSELLDALKVLEVHLKQVEEEAK